MLVEQRNIGILKGSKMKIIFLDIDGVLNGYNKWTDIIYHIRRLLHIENLIDKIYDPCGIHESKVKLLAKIVKKTGSKVVLSSSWRGAYWNIPYECQRGNLKKLSTLFRKYNIEVIGITPKSAFSHSREEEIIDWFYNKQYNISSISAYIVIDDEPTDLQFFIDNGTLIQTSTISRYDMIKGDWKENTGLRRKHVKQAIKILNNV